MSAAEAMLFKSFLTCAERYLEFGAGGSTCLAVSMAKTVISVDSSDEWLATVTEECRAMTNIAPPKLIKVDVGPTGDWGVPLDPNTRVRWPSYYTNVWAEPGSADSDLFLIDGRFRVACFIATALRCRLPAIIMMHDFSSRPQYHIVGQICREIARAEDMSAFAIKPDMDRDRARSILAEYAYEVS